MSVCSMSDCYDWSSALVSMCDCPSGLECVYIPMPDVCVLLIDPIIGLVWGLCRECVQKYVLVDIVIKNG